MSIPFRARVSASRPTLRFYSCAKIGKAMRVVRSNRDDEAPGRNGSTIAIATRVLFPRSNSPGYWTSGAEMSCFAGNFRSSEECRVYIHRNNDTPDHLFISRFFLSCSISCLLLVYFLLMVESIKQLEFLLNYIFARHWRTGIPNPNEIRISFLDKARHSMRAYACTYVITLRG